MICVSQKDTEKYYILKRRNVEKNENEDEKNGVENLQLLKYRYTLNDTYTNGTLNLSL